MFLFFSRACCAAHSVTSKTCFFPIFTPEVPKFASKGGSWWCGRIRLQRQCAIPSCWWHQWSWFDRLRTHFQFQSRCSDISHWSGSSVKAVVLYGDGPQSVEKVQSSYLTFDPDSEAILTLIMGIRFAKTKKVMPAGMVALLSSGGLVFNLLKMKQ